MSPLGVKTCVMPPLRIKPFLIEALTAYAGHGEEYLHRTCNEVIKRCGLPVFTASQVFPLGKDAENRAKFFGTCLAADIASAAMLVLFHPRTIGVQKEDVLFGLQTIAFELGTFRSQGKPLGILYEPGTKSLVSRTLQGIQWTAFEKARFSNREYFFRRATSLASDLLEAWAEKVGFPPIHIRALLRIAKQEGKTPNELTLRDIIWWMLQNPDN